MTLRSKMILMICVTCAVSIATLFFIQQTILANRFARLEQQNTSQNLARATSAVLEDVSSVDTTVGDWAPWDDTYVFVQDGNTDYIANNLNDETLSNLGMNIMLFINNAGELVYGKAFDLENEAETPLPSSVLDLVASGSPLMELIGEQDSVSGILSLPEGPLLIAAQPILTSQKQGPIQGTLIMGRNLDSAEIARLADLTHLSLIVYQPNDDNMPADFQLAQSSLSEEQPTFFHPLSSDSVAGYGLLTDIHGNPSLVLRVDLARDIWAQGQQTTRYVIIAIIVLGLLAGAAFVFLLNRLLLSRLARLRMDVDKVGAARNLAERVSSAGRDELGRVSQAINRTLASLEHAQHELVASEARNRALVAALPDLILRVGRGGTLIDSEPAKTDDAAVAGQQSEHQWPVGTPDERRTLSADVLQRATPHVNQTLDTGKTSIFEFQVPVNSHVSHYEARVVANGENEALVITRDITQKKHEEEVRRRGLLLKEIHHRVKNNLQVVSGLLYLQSTRMSDKKVIEMFNESSNRIQSMSLIHQKLYQSEDATTVDFDGYVRDLIGALLHSYGVDHNAVTVNLNIGRRGLGMDSAIPCGLIINELVSNSLKHAFPEGKKGEINIAMSRDSSDGITLVVADNGIGFPQRLDFLNAESLGLQLVATLVGQLDATISLNRDSGTEFTIKFKEAKPVIPVGIQQEQYEHPGT